MRHRQKECVGTINWRWSENRRCPFLLIWFDLIRAIFRVRSHTHTQHPYTFFDHCHCHIPLPFILNNKSTVTHTFMDWIFFFLVQCEVVVGSLSLVPHAISFVIFDLLSLSFLSRTLSNTYIFALSFFVCGVHIFFHHPNRFYKAVTI